MTLVLTILMLVLSNVTKKKGLPNVVMVLSCDIRTTNLMLKPSNVTKT